MRRSHIDGTAPIRRARKLEVIKLPSSRRELAILSVVFISIGGWFVYSGMALSRDTLAVAMPLLGLTVISLALLFFVSPMLRGHVMTPTKLVVRYGLLFAAEIPIDLISHGKELSLTTFNPLFTSFGVRYVLPDERLWILRSHRGALLLRLREELLLGRIFKRRVCEIVFDTLRPELVLERIHDSEPVE